MRYLVQNLLKSTLLFFLSLFSITSFNASQGQNIQITASKKDVCTGEAITLTAQGQEILGWKWDNDRKDTTASIIVKPTKDTSFTVTAKVRSETNLVVNGDFEQGNVGFNSDYVFVEKGIISPPGGYGVRNDAHTGHYNWASCLEHGNMLVADGAASGYRDDLVPPGSNVWCQTITVEPFQEYVFSAWITGLVPPSSLLSFSINGEKLEDPHFSMDDIWKSPEDTCNWREFYALWKNTQGVESITICLQESTGVVHNNDFALDDIAFYKVIPIETSIDIKTDSVRFNVLTTDITCNNNNDGSIVVEQPTSGIAPFSCQINEESTQIPSNFNDLSPGSYKIVVFDSLGCQNDTTVFIAEPKPLLIDLVRTFLDCQDENSGSIIASVKGGNGDYSYFWQDFPTQTSNKLLNVPAGEYSVTVKDANNCQQTKSVVLDPVPSISIVAPDKDLICLGETIKLSASVNGLPVDSWNEGVIKIANVGEIEIKPKKTTTYTAKTAIPVGDYGQYCEIEKDFTIQVDSVQFNLVKTDITCNNNNDGSIVVEQPTSGIAPFSCQINEESTQIPSNFNDLSPGSYKIVVFDSQGCSHAKEVTINEPDSLVLELLFQKNVTCFNENNGTATVTASGGHGQPYHYTWSNNQIGETASDLSAGTYTVTVNDSKACTQKKMITIQQPSSPIGATIFESATEHVKCYGEASGKSTVTVSGGNEQFYFYLWSDGQISPTAKNLSAGTYTVTVRDDKNCTATASVTITQPELLSVNLKTEQAKICPYEPAVVYASITGGVEPIQIDWGYLKDSATISAYLTKDSTFRVRVVDANACTKEAQIQVKVSTLPKVTFRDEPWRGCTQQQVPLVNLSTGDIMNCEWIFSDGTIIQGCDSINYDVVDTGYVDVQLKVYNSDGCSATHTAPKMIHADSRPVAAFTTDNTIYDIMNAEVKFTNMSQYASYYRWNFGDTSWELTSLNAQHTYPSEHGGVYTATLIASNKTHTCQDTAITTIAIKEMDVFFIPNAFTPNKDGFNELYMPIISAGVSPNEFLFEVYDRWGECVFKTTELHNGWDGTHKGQLVLPGLYTWKITMKMAQSAEKKIHIGHMNLLK